MAESSPDRLSRLLTLVPWLTAHSGVSKAVAAAHFGLTVEQLEADLELISFTGPGLYGGELVDLYFEDETITVFDSQGLDRPLQLTSDEVATLLIGLRALQQLPDVDTESIASAISKLGATDDTEHVAFDVITPDAAAVIADALRRGQDVEIEYVHPLRDDTSVRRISPLRLFSSNGADYVDAWCHTAEAQRTFRLDRIIRCELAGERASTTAAEPAPQSTRLRAKVRIAPAARHVLEGIPATIRSEDGTLEVDVEYTDERWLTQWVISAGGGVSVREPAGVDDAARKRAEAALLAYGAI